VQIRRHTQIFRLARRQSIIDGRVKLARKMKRGKKWKLVMEEKALHAPQTTFFCLKGVIEGGSHFC
jgi:hypothetical protein